MKASAGLRGLFAGTGLAVLSLASVSCPAATLNINPADYPALDAKELGQIRHIVRLSRQPPGDWTDMGTDLWGVAERTKQFELSYMADAIGLIQHNYTPAYRELYRRTMDDLIQKMTVPDVWETWINSSRGGSFRSKSGDVTHGWIDPIKKYNIMLKAYLLQSAAMYEMFYRDGKYDKPDAFTFRHMARTWGNGPITFRYSLPDIAKIIYQEYVDGHYEGVQCEPNVIFPECNQPPILGLINYDQVHGTGYAADVMPKFKAAWDRKHYTDPVTKANIDHLVVSSGEAVGKGGPVGDGWAGSWRNAWDPDYMKSTYPALYKLYWPLFKAGEYARHVPEYGNKDILSLGFGLFGFMAAEVGDTETRARMLDYADRNFNPVWKDGEYYYPRNSNYQLDANGATHGVDTWTGNALLALIRLDEGNGFLKLYREPWGEAELKAPHISNVDYLTTNVSQAWYDARKKALIVTLEPGPVKADATSFVVAELNPQDKYRVFRDGKAYGRLTKETSREDDPVRWRKDGTALISSDFGSPHSFVIMAVD